MALVKNDTKVSIHKSKIPTGVTLPAGTNLSSSQPTYKDVRINVDKATVENTDKAVTFDNILTDAVVGVEAQVATLLAGDDIGSTATANYNVDWKDVRNNQPISEDFYNDNSVDYVCTVDIYVVIS